MNIYTKRRQRWEQETERRGERRWRGHCITHTHTHTHTHTRGYTLECTTHTQNHTETCADTRAHKLAYTFAHTHRHKHILTPMNAHTYTDCSSCLDWRLQRHVHMWDQSHTLCTVQHVLIEAYHFSDLHTTYREASQMSGCNSDCYNAAITAVVFNVHWRQHAPQGTVCCISRVLEIPSKVKWEETDTVKMSCQMQCQWCN